jgi:hypothetical protein
LCCVRGAMVSAQDGSERWPWAHGTVPCVLEVSWMSDGYDATVPHDGGDDAAYQQWRAGQGCGYSRGDVAARAECDCPVCAELRAARNGKE